MSSIVAEKIAIAQNEQYAILTKKTLFPKKLRKNVRNDQKLKFLEMF